MIRLYQRTTKWVPPTCRFTPSCSNYTLQAIEKYGLIKGSWMGCKRIGRCNPWHPGGHDPVPQRFRKNSMSQQQPPRNSFFNIIIELERPISCDCKPISYLSQLLVIKLSRPFHKLLVQSKPNRVIFKKISLQIQRFDNIYKRGSQKQRDSFLQMFQELVLQ